MTHFQNNERRCEAILGTHPHSQSHLVHIHHLSEYQYLWCVSIISSPPHTHSLTASKSSKAIDNTFHLREDAIQSARTSAYCFQNSRVSSPCCALCRSMDTRQRSKMPSIEASPWATATNVRSHMHVHPIQLTINRSPKEKDAS